MIKVEYKYLEDKKVNAIAFEASSLEDLKTLDLLFENMSINLKLPSSYLSTTRFVVHFKESFSEVIAPNSNN